MFTLKVDNDIELRLHDNSNIEEFFHLIDHNRSFLNRWLDWEDMHQSPEDSRQYMLLERKNLGKLAAINTVIEYRGKVVGSIGLMIHNWAWGHGEIGYWLGEEFTGKGIITRAAKTMLDYAFNTLGLHKIIIRAIKENEASWQVAERLGFQHEGFQIQQRLLRGEYYDYTIFYHLAADWSSSNAPEFAHRIDSQIELRPFMPHHAPPFFALIDNNRRFLREWLDWVDKTESLQDIEDFINRGLGIYGDYDGIRLGIWYEGKACGQVGFNYWDLRSKKGEIGYWLAPSHTGKGIMTKAVAALVDYGFKVIGLHRVEIMAAEGNLKSQAIPKRLGFTFEGVMRSGEIVNGKFLDDTIYSMLDQEWKRP